MKDVKKRKKLRKGKIKKTQKKNQALLQRSGAISKIRTKRKLRKKKNLPQI